ncbi:MAG: FtsX-like permease family protein [Thaumarchaeota archaeon]|nr:FtsX-like permease family protein [Nitrososphaerota archaeon]
MDLAEMLDLAFRSIVNDPKRSTLYVLTIALLVMVISAPIAIANGYSQQLLSIIPALTPDRVLIVNSSARSLSDSVLSYQLIGMLDEKGFERMIPQLITYSNVEMGDRLVEVRIRGIENLEIFYRDEGVRVNGSKPSSDLEANVGILLARRLGIELGDEVKLTMGGSSWTLKVVGVIDCSCPYDDEMIVLLRDAWRLRPDLENKVTLVEVAFSEESELDELEAKGVKLLYEKPFEEAAAETISATLQSIKSWTIPIYLVVFVAAYLIGLKISDDSEREVAILRCIGASRKKALTFILSKSILIIVIASVVGLALGMVSAQIVFRALSLIFATKLYEPPSLMPMEALQILVFTQLFALAGAVYPALRSSRRVGEEAWLSIHQ